MKKYENEVVHIIGGINEYIGRIKSVDETEHGRWIRITDPCRHITFNTTVNGKTIVNAGVARIWQQGKLYKHHIDIYCPNDSLMEVMVVDPDGALYKQYQTELNRVSLDRIVSPSGADLARINSGKH